ncbi:MAG: M20/M25/M40 family metallo-hydrolase [Pirellulaceae bacterium]|nr:M20/M25/M40 family metallo-hydrolase [Pirellulaceae bacterium]
MAEQSRGSMQLQSDKWQLAYDEGAAVVLEPGRGDGGTVFVASVTMPRKADQGRGADTPFSRGPRPWATDESEILPQVVLAAEHYNRLVRMVQKEAHPKVEIDIASRFYNDDQNCFNIVAEIPGSDLKDEIVMLGAHFDSWHSGTGATDNAVGCGVAMEAVRILKSIGAQPRRTVRIALWTGEEQGLLGSKAYVTQHFGRTVTEAGQTGQGERPKTKYELKPDHEKLSAYFNLDNGTGKIRGLHMQGNEQLRSMFRTWLAPFGDMGASTLTNANTGGTDHLSFDAIGLPGFQFIQDPLEYDTRTHHSSMDVFERIQADDVKQASIIMATFVYQAAMRDEKLLRKPLDGEVIIAK